MKERVSVLSLAAVVCLLAQPATTGQNRIDLFEKSIRPVLVERCYGCHSRSAEKLRGGLYLDSRQGVLAGGDSGPAIVPGDPGGSLLIQAIRRQHPTLAMPPDGKLPDRVIADFARWVGEGAVDPRDGDRDDGGIAAAASTAGAAADSGALWAFRPAVEPAVPDVADPSWCRSPIDRFVLARLEEAGIAPAPGADRRTLVRRWTYLLTGLPPTPAEIDAFVEDSAPDAPSRLLDRLLASPRYGERQGRRWLDVARYADSNGMDENVAYANAFRYRDWVIDAFNEDLPFDRFIAEQIAGDLLPVDGDAADESEERRLARHVATGFLSIGPKMLACDDGRKMELDIVDEQVDTVGRAFLGMTFGCARCHDHKFDPISTADYHALAGIFKSTKTMESFNVVAEWHEHDVATGAERERQEAHARRLAGAQKALADQVRVASEELVAAERAKIERYVSVAASIVRDGVLDDVADAIGGAITPSDLAGRGVLLEAERFARGTLSVDTTHWGKDIGVLLQTGFAEHDVELPAAGLYRLELRYAAEESRPVTLSIDGVPVKTAGAARTTGGWMAVSQRWHVEGFFELRAGRNVLRIERAGAPVPHIDKVLLVLAQRTESDAARPRRTLVDLVRENGLRQHFLEQWIAFLKTDDARVAALLAAPEGAAGGATLDSVAADPEGPFRLPEKPEGLFPEAARATIFKRRAAVDALEKSKPEPVRAMGVRDGKAEDLPVFTRGDYLQPGDVAPRGFPAALTTATTPSIPDGASGRLELARWLTTGENPLTARVAANRVWLWCLGEGIVRSPDNFGVLGERPTHPELLDWMARRLVDDDNSIKRLERRILLSATSSTASAFDARADAVDPENRLRWRTPRRRLDAEEIRDAMLFLGGSLDFELGGQLLADKNRAYVYGAGARESTYAFDRRTVYLPVLRSAVYQVLQTFDFPDPSVIQGQRIATTVAPQALFLMNSGIVLRESRRFADRLLARADLDDRDRLRWAYRETLGRPPEEREMDRALEHVERFGAELAEEDATLDARERRARGWQSFLHVLLASNEFLHLE